MNTVDTIERPVAPAAARRRGAGFALMAASSASNQIGAALGASAFGAIGPIGVVAVRQIVVMLALELGEQRVRFRPRAQPVQQLGEFWGWQHACDCVMAPPPAGLSVRNGRLVVVDRRVHHGNRQ